MRGCSVEAVRVSQNIHNPSQLSILGSGLCPSPGIIFIPSRTYTERASDGLAAWNGTRRSAKFAGSQCLRGSLVLGGGPGRPRQRERTARVHVRASARTNGERRRNLSTLGHPASRQIHPCAERRRKAASEAPVQLERPRSRRLSQC